MKSLFNVKKHFAIFAIMAAAMMLPNFAYAATGYNNCKHRISDNKCIGGCESYVIEYDYTANQGSSKQGIKLNSTAGDFGDAVYRGTAQVGGKWYWFFDRVVTHIESGAFDKKKMEINISEIELPEGVTTLDPNVFAGCVTLENITLPSTLTTIGSGAFSGCTNLETITIPEGVTTIEPNAFSGCTSLESVTIPSSVTSIGAGAFNGCSDLDNITIPENVTSIGAGAFSGCTDLTTVVIPDNVTTIGNNAFSGCTNLESVTVGEGVTNIGDNAFSGCTNLTDVTLNSCPEMGENAIPAPTPEKPKNLYLSMNSSLSPAEWRDQINDKINNQGYTLASLSFKRDMPSSQWGSSCLPFACESNDEVWYYELSEVEWGGVMVFKKLNRVEANQPCLFYKVNSEATSVDLQAANFTITVGDARNATLEHSSSWTMKGTYTDLFIDAVAERAKNMEYYCMSQNNLVHALNTMKIKAYRAYFVCNTSSASNFAAPSRFSIEVKNAGMETGLKSLSALDDDGALYDLLGNRVNQMVKGRIYILNGKKVMFK